MSDADVAELADAQGLGPCDSNVMGVQLPPSAIIRLSCLEENAGVAQLVERYLAKVVVVGSRPITRFGIFFQVYL